LKHVKEKKSLDVILNILSRNDPGEVDENNVTALIWECFNSLEDIALSIIATGRHNPGQVTNNGNTALFYACSNNLKKCYYIIIRFWI
jgi:ankyrin repeat protein